MVRKDGRSLSGPAVAAAALLLAGCDENNFTADLATDPPADPAVTGVSVNLRGLEFRQSDGSTPTLEFRDGEIVNLLDLDEGSPVRLFTDEELPAGSYTGVRLRFDSRGQLDKSKPDLSHASDAEGYRLAYLRPLRLAAPRGTGRVVVG